MLILLELFSIFGRRKFIINFVKLSTMVAFCPGGLLSEWSLVRVGIFGGLLSGGFLSGGLFSVQCNTVVISFVNVGARNNLVKIIEVGSEDDFRFSEILGLIVKYRDKSL